MHGAGDVAVTFSSGGEVVGVESADANAEVFFNPTGLFDEFSIGATDTLEFRISDLTIVEGQSCSSDPDYSSFNPIQRSDNLDDPDYMRGTTGSDLFIFGTNRMDAQGDGGVDAYRIDALSDGTIHKVRDYQTDDLVDLSGVLDFMRGDEVSDFVRLTGDSVKTLEIDSDGNANGVEFVKVLKLTGVEDLDLGMMLDADGLFLG